MKTSVLLVILLTTLTGCNFSLPYDSISGVYPLLPSQVTRGQEVANFWTIPDRGQSQVLVVPIEFDQLPFTAPTMVQGQLDQAFNQNLNDGFVSLKEFYQQSSFGNVSINAVITAPFQTRFQASYYENLTNQDPNTVIIDELLAHLDSHYDFNDFDADQDGRLDGLYMIYNHPAGEWNSFFWAYLYEYFGSNRADGVIPTSYVWMPYEFIVKNNQVDASTLIHETGHKLGLEDYYDYAPEDGSNNEWGLGGADMMDGTVGDHNPFSKLLLGWIQPRVITESMDITLLPYETSGQAFIITDEWKGSLFDEYFIAIYFTPTGLYAGLDDYYFDGQSGLVLYHVDARLGPNLSPNYPTYFLNNNTDSTYKLIKFVEADGNNSLYLRNPKGWMWASDVFRAGDTFPGIRNAGYAWNQPHRGPISFNFRVNEEGAGRSYLSLSVRF